MTNETPGKILSLLAAAMVSLSFLFMVTITDANFQGYQGQLPDPFDPAKIVASLDTVANSYSNLVYTLAIPAKNDFAFAADIVSGSFNDVTDVMAANMTVPNAAPVSNLASVPAMPKVAGASTMVPNSEFSLLDNIYSLLIK